MQLNTSIGLTTLIELLIAKGVITHDEYYTYLQKQRDALIQIHTQGDEIQKSVTQDFIDDLDLLLSTK